MGRDTPIVTRSNHEPFFIQLTRPGEAPVRLQASVRESRAQRQFEKIKQENPQAAVALIPPQRLQADFKARLAADKNRPKRSAKA